MVKIIPKSIEIELKRQNKIDKIICLEFILECYFIEKNIFREDYGNVNHAIAKNKTK